MASSTSSPPASSRLVGNNATTTTAPPAAAITPKNSYSSSSSSLTNPGPPPVDIRSSPVAQTYAHAHPALLLALYALRFPALVADPVSTLTSDLPLYAALQVVYVVTCLPQAGSSHHHYHEGPNPDGSGDAKKTSSSSSGTTGGGSLLKASKTASRKKSGKGGGGNEIFGKLTAAFLSLTLTFLLGTPVLAVLLVLFGAPFTTHLAHTLLCAAHMSLLSVTMLVYVHGVDAAVWRQVWAFARPADVVWGGALGTCVGAWLGAVPIPLDWDRPWQEYPITILTGAYIGFAVGSLVARTPLLFGKRIEFNNTLSEETAAPPQGSE